MTDHKIPCSVLILTRNSAATLERCLETLGNFGEILVHDANSEDNSVEIAKRFGAKVLKQYDTEEKSVRVKDFTELRLRQRADAAFDWVFYLDSDECIPVETVEEIGQVIATADIKTIIKMLRVPVIDGIPRTRGAFRIDAMPRIHHRKGGCTLQGGKTVHEKYVYDSSFTEIVLKNPLYTPLESVASMRSKDDRYIRLEVERIWKEGYPWSHWFKWFALREPLIIARLMFQIILFSPHYTQKSSIPFTHDWRYVRYHWRLFRAITGAMFRHPFTSGRLPTA
jgi:glycosyltransferase involved in cell wall biosynthesis